jgi:hypothetical protein
MEWKMQELGFQFTYDKRLYDRLRENSAEPVRAHLLADVSYQSKLARFLENHDEPRAAAVFPRQRIASVVTLFSTLPGMRFYHHGQLDGLQTFVPMPLAKAQSETTDGPIRALYEKLLRFTQADVFHNGEWRLLDVLSAGDDTYKDIVAYRWSSGSDQRLIVVNLGSHTALGRVTEAASGVSTTYRFRDRLDESEYLRERLDINRNGLYIKLAPHHAHAFEIYSGS